MGAAGASFLNRLKASGRGIKIKIIDKKESYFPREQIAKNPSDLSLIKRIDELADSPGVEFICAKVEKVNEKARRITLDNSQRVEFKNLVVASGAISQKINIKGDKKQGCFYLSELDPKEVKAELKVYQEVSVLANSLEGVQFSRYLASLGKEVRIITLGLDFLGFEKEDIVRSLNRENIQIYSGYTLLEVIGEKSVKAVKISKDQESSHREADKVIPTKVLSSQLVFLDSKLRPNIDFFNDPENIFGEEKFFTKYDSIYIIGDAANQRIGEQSSYSGNCCKAKEDGRSLAEYILAKNK